MMPRHYLGVLSDEGVRVDASIFGGNSMQHGTAVFEGIRCYTGPAGRAIFRLDDHLVRLLASARLLGIVHRYSQDELRERVIDAAATFEEPDLYLRPVLFCVDPRLSVDLGALDFRFAIAVWAAGPSAVGTQRPLRLTVSPWRRPARQSFPVQAKATGTYVTSAVAKTGAVAAGFDDAIQLDSASGRVAEATAANVFAVRDGRLTTPWLADGPLAGITRDAVLVLARALEIEVSEGPVTCDELDCADEVFLTGTACELLPGVEIDGRVLPRRRPLFDSIAAAFHDATTGRRFAELGWCTPVRARSGFPVHT